MPGALSTLILNSKEAASLLQIHPKTLQKLAREGTVPAFQIGTLWRYRADELDAWMRTQVNSMTPLVPN
jgi:excisionase family DNA binding protein